MSTSQTGPSSPSSSVSNTSVLTSWTSPPVKTKHVAIVGAGACGLVCARECIREGHCVRVFEQSTASGGTWVVHPIPSELQTMDVLSETYKKRAGRVHSSMYEELRTNLPRELMGFLDFPFDHSFGNAQDLRRHCCHQEVRRYLEAFKTHYGLDRWIEYRSRVIRVEHFDRPFRRWDVEVQSEGKRETFRFDAVIVANGHFTVPYVPDIEGIDRFGRRRLHSHLYRNPSPFKDQTVALLGNSKSGKDLADQIGEVANTVYFCGRSWPPGTDCTKPVGRRQNIHLCPTIASSPGEGRLKLQGGRVLKDVDALMFCTGYLHEYPFLKGSCSVSTDDWIVYPLYNHVLHATFPTLAIANIHHKIVSFVWAEQQAKYIARTFSERISVPDFETRMKEIDDELEQHRKRKQSMKSFLFMGEKQIDYFRQLAALSGDPDPIPDWWKRMRVVTKSYKAVHPDNFQDVQIDDVCFDRAWEYFSLVGKQSNKKCSR